MAYSFPVALVDFFDGLTVKETQLWAPPAVEVGDETNGGEIITVSRGARLWEGQVVIAADTSAESDKAFAMMELLMGAGASFLIRPRHRLGPTLDPTPSGGLGGITLGLVNANRRDIRLDGLPANYAGLGTGSFLSFTYDTSRMAFHRVVKGSSANASGAATPEVSPPIRSGYVIGSVVTINKPVLKAVVKPGSVKPPRQLPGGVSVGFSFDWRQTLGK